MGFLLKDRGATWQKREAEQDEEIKRLRDDLAAYKVAAAREFVLREDYIRGLAGLDCKMDQMREDITARIAGVCDEIKELRKAILPAGMEAGR